MELSLAKLGKSIRETSLQAEHQELTFGSKFGMPDRHPSKDADRQLHIWIRSSGENNGVFVRVQIKRQKSHSNLKRGSLMYRTM